MIGSTNKSALRLFGRNFSRRWNHSPTEGRIGPSNMQIDAYRDHSSKQYQGHLGCVSMLLDSIDRLAKRIDMEDNYQEVQRRRHIVDLGSADGSNSMNTLRTAVHHLRKSVGVTPPLHITFEEHPKSDETSLQKTLENNADWFVENNATSSILMKSFYEPLFEPDSLDMLVSYICLHWLDTSDVLEGNGSISEWKRLHLPKNGMVANKGEHKLSQFTFINEVTAPEAQREYWRKCLAKVHLANFLALRARELRPGAEALLVMVAHGTDFVVPSRGGPSPLTLAMQRCSDQGLIRPKVLRETIVPYFLRKEDDVKEAFRFCSTIEIGPGNYPGSLLELVDVRTYPAELGHGESTLDGTFNLFWSIHCGAVESGGATEGELECVKKETRVVFDETYEVGKKITVTFLAFVVRRRTRQRW